MEVPTDLEHDQTYVTLKPKRFQTTQTFSKQHKISTFAFQLEISITMNKTHTFFPVSTSLIADKEDTIKINTRT